VPRRNSRDPESDPAAAFGQALGRLREAAGIATQEAAAARLNYGHDSISRWETGAAVPDETQVNRLLNEYEATGLLRENTMARWRLARKAKGPIREFFQRYFAEEQAAAFLRVWGLLMVPGPLQTQDYAYASDIVDQVTVVDYVTDDQAVVGKVIARFAKVHGYARNVAESRTLITEAITFWQSQQK
jgi:transcriptional regulator with XRE-family HTH domain